MLLSRQSIYPNLKVIPHQSDSGLVVNQQQPLDNINQYQQHSCHPIPHIAEANLAKHKVNTRSVANPLHFISSGNHQSPASTPLYPLGTHQSSWDKPSLGSPWCWQTYRCPSTGADWIASPRPPLSPAGLCGQRNSAVLSHGHTEIRQSNNLQYPWLLILNSNRKQGHQLDIY